MQLQVSERSSLASNVNAFLLVSAFIDDLSEEITPMQAAFENVIPELLLIVANSVLVYKLFQRRKALTRNNSAHGCQRLESSTSGLFLLYAYSRRVESLQVCALASDELH